MPALSVTLKLGHDIEDLARDERGRDALRAQLLSERERLERWLTAPDGKQYERGTVQAVFDECDALRAQMEAAREAAERIVKTQWRMPDCYITATAILRAMDEAKP